MVKPGDKIIDEKSGKKLVAVEANNMQCDSCFYAGKSCMHIDCTDTEETYGIILVEEDTSDMIAFQDAVNAFCKICNTTEDSEMCKKFINELKGYNYEY